MHSLFIFRCVIHFIIVNNLFGANWKKKLEGEIERLVNNLKGYVLEK